MFTKIPWYRSLIWKLLITLIIIGFVPVFFFADTTINSVENYFMEQRQGELIRIANITADRVFRGNYLLELDLIEDLRQAMFERSREENVRLIILDINALVLADSGGIEEGNTLIVQEVLSVLQNFSPASNIQANSITRHTAVPINDEESNLIGVALLVSSVQDINDLVDLVSTQTEMLNIITAGFAGASAIFVSYLILNPLKRLLKAVERMGEGDLNQRVKVTGHDEFSRLCRAFNNMNDKLEQVEKTREEFVSNVSHELKTPLSSIKVLSESILFQENVPKSTYREFLQDINSEVGRMDRIINDLLTLVKLDQTTAFINITDVNINEMIGDIIKRLKPIAKLKDITITGEYTKEVTLKGDEMKLALAISNLVENAIKYTPSGGSVTIITTADHQHAFITVKDTGIGIADEEQNKIFARFYRVDKTRDRDTGGTGLGLSITHTTVLLHKGSIRVSSKRNEGTSFIVRLPRGYKQEQTEEIVSEK